MARTASGDFTVSFVTSTQRIPALLQKSTFVRSWMELFFPETSTTIRFSRLSTRSGRNALGTAAPPHFSQLTEERASCGPTIGASALSTANSALQSGHLTEDRSTILQSRSAAMPYQLREARKEVSALVCETRNSL